ncbi:hypothetical protein RMSM_02552 [Rhodopirellula maiorica SM1]|uniref:Uncharacterized protein n=1 Tax=Rhodopirellula maiorica SM1 TaxID=1265738 RepID=M5RMI8_9BACT|nr:hypothetical protein [Rhodopirellula maiorica]EMI20520.1 hypothetical protein RMSM_02552 [Rhodopirellula maiorica SM1]
MLEQLGRGPIILDRMYHMLSHYDEDAPLLDDIKPLRRYADAFTTEVKNEADRVRAIVTTG